MIRNAHRMLGVHPRLCAFLLKASWASDFDIWIAEGKRNDKRQADLYAQGRTTPGNIVTNAKPGQTPHSFGLALDVYPSEKDGEFNPQDSSKEQMARFEKLGELALEFGGITWGGKFTSLVDKPHFELENWVDKKDWAVNTVAVIAALALVFRVL